VGKLGLLLPDHREIVKVSILPWYQYTFRLRMPEAVTHLILAQSMGNWQAKYPCFLARDPNEGELRTARKLNYKHSVTTESEAD
jgi:hypothetical protein